jgi:HUS1 checkpoint protein
MEQLHTSSDRYGAVPWPLSSSLPVFLSDSVAADGASQINDEDEAEGRERPDPQQLFSVLVHTRSFLKFLNAHAVSKTTIACTNGPFFHSFRNDNFGIVGICQGHCLILFVYIGDSADVGGVLTFYIPSVLDN